MFAVATPDGRHFAVTVWLGGSASAIAEGEFDADGDEERTRLLDDGLLRFGALRIQQGFRDGLFADVATDTIVPIYPQEADIPLLVELATTKTCEYQVQEGRDLFCTAAATNDETMIGSSGLHRVAPTSRSICNRCDLPSTDIICSHLMHPEIWGHLTTGVVGGVPARGVKWATCDIGRSEIEQPGRCRPGYNPCWTFVIASRPSAPLEIVPPEALVEALDHCDTAWRLLVHADGLLRMKSASEVAGLLQRSTSREEFESRMSDLDDIMKSFEIPDEVLDDPAIATKAQTFKRMRAALLTRVEEDAMNEVDSALDDLSAINRIRVGLQHSDAAAALPENFARLGISAPAADWGHTWEMVRTRAVAAFETMTRIMRRSAVTK